MYNREFLCKFPFFHRLLQQYPIENIQDSLTGVIMRRYFLDFVQDLISQGKAFTLAILDLDNFKWINDKYGHHTGDEVLAELAGRLIRFFGNDAVVGRFGGDEFLFVYFGGNDYDHLHDVILKLFNDKSVLRINYTASNSQPYVTATLGSACFPEDAADFESLSTLVDKTLYRGKTKGRNCFIIYVHEKHKDIEIKKLPPHKSSDALCGLIRLFEEEGDLSIEERLQIALGDLRNTLGSFQLFYITGEGKLFNVENSLPLGTVRVDDELLDEHGFFLSEEEATLREKAPFLFPILYSLDIVAIVLTKIAFWGKDYGYLFFAASRINRLWQDDEKTLLLCLARLTAEYLSRNE